ncbi:tripartite ATP-independent transporter solute receptor, DctP family [Tenuibacillus multivorans]|uniref:Tripartite ATP-independent transporter solute receptor, DctP family n=2 Tax=Tenuibacillus multivorans TaxID=237069 RepID=A0A1G9WWG9_9BACI|nr:tripartite ATP-independent transporter solute receptor, DctP family [Tenuibacillus multivorans]
MLTLGLFLAACGGSDDGSEEDTPEEDNTGDTGSEGDSSEGESESASDIEEQEWLFVTEEQDGQVQYEYAEEFANRISEKSGGKITVTPYEFGGLGDEVDQVEQLQNGAVQLAVTSPGFIGNMVKESQIFALHFLFPDSVEQTQEILNTSEALNQDLVKQYQEHGLTPLSFWSEGFMQWTANKPLEQPSDFENFKMRVQTSPLIIESYEAYGANPQSMSWGDLYTGLDQGTVDGQENPIFFIADASFNEVQDYMMLSRHNNYVATTTVNSEWYEGLSEEVQTMVDETVDEMQEWVFEEQKAQNEDFLEQIKTDTDTPTEVVELSEEQREAFRELAVPVRDFYRNEVSTVDGAILDKLIEEIEAATAE